MKTERWSNGCSKNPEGEEGEEETKEDMKRGEDDGMMNECMNAWLNEYKKGRRDNDKKGRAKVQVARAAACTRQQQNDAISRMPAANPPQLKLGRPGWRQQQQICKYHASRSHYDIIPWSKFFCNFHCTLSYKDVCAREFLWCRYTWCLPNAGIYCISVHWRV